MFNGITATYGLTLHGLAIVLALLSYVVAAHAFNQRRHPTAAIAWVLFIFLVPYLALPAFLMFGSRKQRKPLPPLPPPDGVDVREPWAARTLDAMGQPPPAVYDALRLQADGHEALRALLSLLDEARQSIDVCTFIIGRDDVGRAVIDRLIAKARAGLRVRVMVDGMGSLMHRQPDLRPLRDAGAEVVVFVPPLRLPLRARMNLRDHRKLVVVDAGTGEAKLWCGGRNFAAEYFAGVEGDRMPPWRDLSFEVRGEIVEQAARLFRNDWAYANGQPRIAFVNDAPSSSTLSYDAATARLVASGPDQVDDTVYTLLVTGAFQATSRIAIATPYFVPDATLLLALSMAARRGVAVELLIPEKSNHPMSDFARRRALRSLASAGGRIWLVPGMLHAKLAVFDDSLALTGSANIDSRSLFLNYELMMAFHHPPDIARFLAWFDAEREKASRYVPKPAGLVTDVAEGLILWAGFQL